MLLITLSAAGKFLFIAFGSGLFVVCFMAAGSIIATKREEHEKRRYIKENWVDYTINKILNDEETETNILF